MHRNKYAINWGTVEAWVESQGCLAPTLSLARTCQSQGKKILYQTRNLPLPEPRLSPLLLALATACLRECEQAWLKLVTRI